MSETNNTQIETIEKKLDLFEKTIENASIQRELTVNQIQFFSEEFKNIEGYEDLTKAENLQQYTLDQILQQVSLTLLNPSDKKNAFSLETVEKYSQQEKAIFLLKTLPTINTFVKDTKSAEQIIQWAMFLNTNDFHLHSSDLDDLSRNLISKISEKGVFKNVKKCMENVDRIFEITQKNCSPKFLDTFSAIIREIEGSKLFDSKQKNELIYDLIPRLKDSILIAYKDEIFSPFVCGESQLFTILDQIGKILNEDKNFETNEQLGTLEKLKDYFTKESNKNLKSKAENAQSDLDTIVGLLYDIYFKHMDKYGNIISPADKQLVLKRLIPHDSSGRNEFFVAKISDRINSPNYSAENFSNDFDTDILEIILRSPTDEKHHNRNIKIKCVELIGDIYCSDEKKNRELDGYIKESFDNPEQPPEINEVLLKKLLKIYDSTNDKYIKTNIASLILFVFNRHMDFVIKTVSSEFEDFMNNLFRNEFVDEDHKKKFFDSLIQGYTSTQENDRKNFVYRVMENIFNNNYSEVSRYPNFKDSFSLFIDQLKDTNKSNGAKGSLVHFLCDKKIPTKNSLEVNKKNLLDYLEANFSKFNRTQKYEILDICESALDDAEEDLVLQLRDTVVNHFMKENIASYNSPKKFSIQLSSNTGSGNLYRLYKIILGLPDAKSEWDEIIKTLKDQILNADISSSEREICYDILRSSLKYQQDSVTFIKLSLELLHEMN